MTSSESGGFLSISLYFFKAHSFNPIVLEEKPVLTKFLIEKSKYYKYFYLRSRLRYKNYFNIFRAFIKNYHLIHSFIF